MVVLDEGIPAHEFVSEYIGELYPPWRWFERQDAVASAQRAWTCPPACPTSTTSSWNARATTRRAAMDSCVDASKRANYSSSLSHSCTRTASREWPCGRVASASCSPRSALIAGEELTFDYGAVTSNIEEYRLAVCLCGILVLPGFLDFVASDSTQQLLTRWHSPTDRFAMLFDASVSQFRSAATKRSTDRLLRSHGLGRSAMGLGLASAEAIAAAEEEERLEGGQSSAEGALVATKQAASKTTSGTGTTTGIGKDDLSGTPFWLRRFCAKTLTDFVDKERVYLPIQLKLDGVGAQAANQEARSLIEQRIQSLVTLSCVARLQA